MIKLQTPSSKRQRSAKSQAAKQAMAAPAWLGFGDWCLSGVWNLVFGVFAIALGAWCIVCLNGCAIGPNYKRPAIDSPGNFRGATNTVSNESIANRPWWERIRSGVYRGERLGVVA